MLSVVKKLWVILTPEERRRSLGLIAMMVVSAMLEVVGIGLIVPVIGLLARPELAEQNGIIIMIKQVLAPSASNRTFILILCGTSIILFLGKNLFLVVQAYFQARFVFGMGSRLGNRLYETYIHAPYTFHLERNAGHLMGALELSSAIPSALLMPGMVFVSEAIVVAAILFVLLVLSPVVTLCLTALIAVISAAIYYPMRRRNYEAGVTFQRESLERQKYALQGLKGIKESKVRNVEAFFAAEYARHQHAVSRAQAVQSFLGNIPRFAIEAMVVSLGLGALAVLLLANMATGSIILTLSLLAVSMVRLMPSFTRMQYSLAVMRQHQAVLDSYHAEAVDLVCEDKTAKRPDRPFLDRISLRSLSFRYATSGPEVISNFSLDIPKNTSVAFVGPTGCGKTTLVDLILGLLKPSFGEVLVDGVGIGENLPAWQTRVGYVPQFIFLLDDTILANVAFGVPVERVNESRVAECLRTAQICDFVDSLPQGLRTIVGENGIRLSGGQRQRVGIARALYHNPEILVLDEATSALDNDTEKAFVDALRALHGKLTIIMVAHRLTTVQNCDHILEIGR